MKAKKKDTNETIAETGQRPRGVPSKRYPGLIYLYPTEPSIIGEDKIIAAVKAVSAERRQREAAERAAKRQKRR